MAENGVTTAGDTEMPENDGEKVVTMMDVLQEQQDFEDDANAVLGASDDKECTYSKGYINRQAVYACLTCCSDAKTDDSKRAGVCLACSLACHENHELVELYTKRNFRCDCGNPKFNGHPCQFTPSKTDLNEDNIYNQNFSGLYCVCHRPYPDPDTNDEDEMIQCIICEDWLHAAHLEAAVPNPDKYAEMICKECLDKNEFLHDYSEFAVNSVEVGDIDVVNESVNNGLDKANGAEADPDAQDKSQIDIDVPHSEEKENHLDCAEKEVTEEKEEEKVGEDSVSENREEKSKCDTEHPSEAEPKLAEEKPSEEDPHKSEQSEVSEPALNTDEQKATTQSEENIDGDTKAGEANNKDELDISMSSKDNEEGKITEDDKMTEEDKITEEVKITEEDNITEDDKITVEDKITDHGPEDKDTKLTNGHQVNNENKRKLTNDDSEENDPSKKAKIETCVRPKGVKKVLKGAAFWPYNFRQKLCTCSQCLDMYRDLSVLFLTDAEDTVTAYENLGKERTDGVATTQYEQGLEALSSLDRIQQINALTEYNKMRDKLLDFLKSFKERKEVVKEEDIKAFFAGMKPKKESDGVYFCR